MITQANSPIIVLNEQLYALLFNIHSGSTSKVWKALKLPDGWTDSRFTELRTSETQELLRSEEELGYKAPEAASSIPVAIKVPLTEEEATQLAQEAEILVKYFQDEPDYVQVIDDNTGDAVNPCLILEWIEAPLVSKLGQALSEAEAAEFLFQLALALEKGRRKARFVIPTDTIKTSSIFWDKANQRIVLSDWNRTTETESEFRSKSLIRFGEVAYQILTQANFQIDRRNDQVSIEKIGVAGADVWNNLTSGMRLFVCRLLFADFPGDDSRELANAVLAASRDLRDWWRKPNPGDLLTARVSEVPSENLARIEIAHHRGANVDASLLVQLYRQDFLNDISTGRYQLANIKFRTILVHYQQNTFLRLAFLANQAALALAETHPGQFRTLGLPEVLAKVNQDSYETAFEKLEGILGRIEGFSQPALAALVSRIKLISIARKALNTIGTEAELLTNLVAAWQLTKVLRDQAQVAEAQILPSGFPKDDDLSADLIAELQSHLPATIGANAVKQTSTDLLYDALISQANLLIKEAEDIASPSLRALLQAQAIQFWQQARDTYPDHWRNQHQNTELVKAAESLVAYKVEQGDAKLYAGRVNEAWALFQSAASDLPTDVRARSRQASTNLFSVGQAALIAGDGIRAQYLLQTAITLFPFSDALTWVADLNALASAVACVQHANLLHPVALTGSAGLVEQIEYCVKAEQIISQYQHRADLAPDLKSAVDQTRFLLKATLRQVTQLPLLDAQEFVTKVKGPTALQHQAEYEQHLRGLHTLIDLARQTSPGSDCAGLADHVEQVRRQIQGAAGYAIATALLIADNYEGAWDTVVQADSSRITSIERDAFCEALVERWEIRWREAAGRLGMSFIDSARALISVEQDSSIISALAQRYLTKTFDIVNLNEALEHAQADRAEPVVTLLTGAAPSTVRDVLLTTSPLVVLIKKSWYDEAVALWRWIKEEQQLPSSKSLARHEEVRTILSAHLAQAWARVVKEEQPTTATRWTELLIHPPDNLNPNLLALASQFLAQPSSNTFAHIFSKADSVDLETAPIEIAAVSPKAIADQESALHLFTDRKFDELVSDRKKMSGRNFERQAKTAQFWVRTTDQQHQLDTIRANVLRQSRLRQLAGLAGGGLLLLFLVLGAWTVVQIVLPRSDSSPQSPTALPPNLAAPAIENQVEFLEGGSVAHFIFRLENSNSMPVEFVLTGPSAGFVWAANCDERTTLNTAEVFTGQATIANIEPQAPVCVSFWSISDDPNAEPSTQISLQVNSTTPDGRVSESVVIQAAAPLPPLPSIKTKGLLSQNDSLTPAVIRFETPGTYRLTCKHDLDVVTILPITITQPSSMEFLCPSRAEVGFWTLEVYRQLREAAIDDLEPLVKTDLYVYQPGVQIRAVDLFGRGLHQITLTNTGLVPDRLGISFYVDPENTLTPSVKIVEGNSTSPLQANESGIFILPKPLAHNETATILVDLSNGTSDQLPPYTLQIQPYIQNGTLPLLNEQIIWPVGVGLEIREDKFLIDQNVILLTLENTGTSDRVLRLSLIPARPEIQITKVTANLSGTAPVVEIGLDAVEPLPVIKPGDKLSLRITFASDAVPESTILLKLFDTTTGTLSEVMPITIPEQK